MAAETITIIDNRTGKQYEFPIQNGAVRAVDLRQIKTDNDDFGLLSYDPAFMNTASCKSRITFIDGDAGILRYRGYPIEQLAEHSTYLEVAYLLVHGELPTRAQLDAWTYDIMRHTFVHENFKEFMRSFPHDAHPMGMWVSALGALSTYYPTSKRIFDAENRMMQVHRAIGHVPTLGAFAHRRVMGRPFVDPDPDLSYVGNFLSMMFKLGAAPYKPDPVLEHALDVLFILHADHEQNCSANAMRGIGSAHGDPYTALGGAAAALYGPLHGGANEAVLRMLLEIGSKEHIPDYIRRVKSGEVRLMGFGHRIYKNYDPRAKLIKTIAYEVFEVTGRNPLIDIAVELERIALEDEYFIKRKLYPNVDFYSGMIYQAMGFPIEMFSVLFGIARTSGWMSQWLEGVQDPEQKIARPQQIYLGESERNFKPMSQRG